MCSLEILPLLPKEGSANVTLLICLISSLCSLSKLHCSKCWMTPLLEESNSDTISCVSEKIFPLKTSHFTQITWAVVLHLLNLNYINSDFSFTDLAGSPNSVRFW